MRSVIIEAVPPIPISRCLSAPLRNSQSTFITDSDMSAAKYCPFTHGAHGSPACRWSYWPKDCRLPTVLHRSNPRAAIQWVQPELLPARGCIEAALRPCTHGNFHVLARSHKYDRTQGELGRAILTISSLRY